MPFFVNVTHTHVVRLDPRLSAQIDKLIDVLGDQPVDLDRLKAAAAQSKELREQMQAIVDENKPK